MKQLGLYGKAFLVQLIIVVVLSLYLFLRRGYYDLYIFNKAIAGASAVQLALVMLLGTLARLYEVFDRYFKYRKELGIVAFFFASLHSIVSLFYLPAHFPIPSYFGSLAGIVSFMGAGIAAIMLLTLFVLSFRFVIDRMNKAIWWKIQYWGLRGAIAFVLVHVLVKKVPGWIQWYAVGGGMELARPYLPPTGGVVTSFFLFVVLVRIVEYVFKRKAYMIVALLYLLWSSLIGISLQWGLHKTPHALPLDWKTCTALPASLIRESYPAVCVSADGRQSVQPVEAVP